MAEGKKLTIIEHLEELRERLIKSVIAVAVTTLISLIFTSRFLELLIAPMGERKPVALRPTETIVIYFKVALIIGLVMAMPVILYQLIRFLVPGLTRRERTYLYILVPSGTLLFAVGVAFASFIMLPFSIKYLQGFLGDIVSPTYSIDYYISFVTTLVFWVGVIFETPLIVAFLARIGVVSPRLLTSNRKYAILITAIIAAVITPTPDPFNMLLVMAPLLILYEVGVLLARITYKPRPAS
ncbi:MAG: twin-arginine translocase subunit TatC [Anaerolineae bacterium]